MWGVTPRRGNDVRELDQGFLVQDVSGHDSLKSLELRTLGEAGCPRGEVHLVGSRKPPKSKDRDSRLRRRQWTEFARDRREAQARCPGGLECVNGANQEGSAGGRPPAIGASDQQPPLTTTTMMMMITMTIVLGNERFKARRL